MTTPYTPEPANGAALYALGEVPLPTDSDPPRGGIVRAADENILDLLWFMTGGATGDPDFKITGNGTPPAGGYTPLTNPIWIKGPGIKLGQLAWDAATGQVDGLQPVSTATLANTTGSVTVSVSEYIAPPPIVASITTTINDPATNPPAGTIWRVRLWQPKLSTGFSRTIARADASEMAVFPDDTHCAVELSWYATLLAWKVTGGFGFTLGASP